MTKQDLQTAFGQVTSALMHVEPYRGLNLSELEWLVVPAIKTGQFLVVNDVLENDALPPAAVALWAFVNPAVEDKLHAQMAVKAPLFRLEPHDWHSGDQPYLLDVIAPAEHAIALTQRIHREAFAGRDYKMWRGGE